jgi:hypothetical protein
VASFAKTSEGQSVVQILTVLDNAAEAISTAFKIWRKIPVPQVASAGGKADKTFSPLVRQTD